MRLRRKKAKARVEMLALMDVVFLLLVFFIYAMMSMTVHHGLPLNLPQSSTVELERQLSIAVTVKQDGSVFIDKEPVTLEQISRILTEKVATSSANTTKENQPMGLDGGHSDEISVQIFAEDSVSYQELFKVLDQVKAAKIKKISLQATPEPKL